MVRLHMGHWCHHRDLYFSFYSRSTSMQILLFSPPVYNCGLLLSHHAEHLWHLPYGLVWEPATADFKLKTQSFPNVVYAFIFQFLILEHFFVRGPFLP